MPKILLVEDDNNLREIFDMRLQAEGYQTVTAGDGEEALSVAMKEKPDLIIADVMMPKLSGFEMLQALRATPDLADTRVVMMTALGQAEDRARGEKLGVVKYLVKSQVTLEDFVRVVREVLQPDQGSTDSSSAPPVTDAAKTTQPEQSNNKESEHVMPEDTQANPVPPADDQGSATPPTNPMGDAPAGDSATGDVSAAGPVSAADQQGAVQDQVNDFVAGAPAEPAAPAADSGTPSFGTEGSAPAADASGVPPVQPSGDQPPAAEGEEQPPAAPAV